MPNSETSKKNSIDTIVYIPYITQECCGNGRAYNQKYLQLIAYTTREAAMRKAKEMLRFQDGIAGVQEIIILDEPQ